MPSNHPWLFWSRWWRRSWTPPTSRFAPSSNICSSLWRLSPSVAETHAGAVHLSPLARHGRAREDLPHVLQRGAGGCYQGYLKMKKTRGFGQGGVWSYAWAERHHSTSMIHKQKRNLFPNVLICPSCLSASAQLWAALTCEWQENSGGGVFLLPISSTIKLVFKWFLESSFYGSRTT